jgi:hypothetical protein
MNETSGRNSQMLLDGPSGDELDRRTEARDLRQFRVELDAMQSDRHRMSWKSSTNSSLRRSAGSSPIAAFVQPRNLSARDLGAR